MNIQAYRKCRGSLIALEGVSGVTYDELAEITLESGERRFGRVIRIDGDRVVLQVLEGTEGIDMEHVNTHFTGRPITLPLSKEILGRIFDGPEKPIDGLREVYPGKSAATSTVRGHKPRQPQVSAQLYSHRYFLY